MHRQMTSGLNRAVKAGVAWVLVERGALHILSLLADVVLARILSPSDFAQASLCRRIRWS